VGTGILLTISNNDHPHKFSGVSIVSDRFMAAIEVLFHCVLRCHQPHLHSIPQVITSQEREVEVTKVTGEKVKVLVRVWNETVGFSAFEFLESLIWLSGQQSDADGFGRVFCKKMQEQKHFSFVSRIFCARNPPLRHRDFRQQF